MEIRSRTWGSVHQAPTEPTLLSEILSNCIRGNGNCFRYFHHKVFKCWKRVLTKSLERLKEKSEDPTGLWFLKSHNHLELQSRAQKSYCCHQYTHLWELSWWHPSDIRKASLPCLMQVPPTGKTCDATRPLPARESSKWSFLFSNSWNTGGNAERRKTGRDVGCQSTIFNTNFSLLDIFHVAAILPILPLPL